MQYGAGGVLAVLAQLHRHRPSALAERLVRETSGWLTRHLGSQEHRLPGLYFGAAGTALARRAHEPWYAEAVAALRAEVTSPQDLERFRWLSAPLLYGRWNAAAQAQAAAEPAQFSPAATDSFYAGFEPDPALPERLAAFEAPVLLVAGEYDNWPTCHAVRELAAGIPHAEVAELPRTGHFPWVDNPAMFAATVEEFLALRRPAPGACWSRPQRRDASAGATANMICCCG